MNPRRAACWLAGVWTGLLAALGAMAAPAAFATLASSDAGRVAGRLFAQEAYLSVALSIAIFALERFRHRAAIEGGSRSAMSAEILLALGALFCTVAGYFALQPLMEAARAGQGRWSFGALHAVSGSLYVLKGALVAVLAWRLAAVDRNARPQP